MGDVVQAQQRETQQLLTADQVVQVSPGVVLTGDARTGRVEGGVVMPEACVAQIPSFSSHQRCAVSAKPGWNHTVEEINSVGHSDGHLPKCANAHEITRSIGRKQRRHVPHDPVHLLHRLPDADSSDGDAWQIEIRDGLGAFTA